MYVQLFDTSNVMVYLTSGFISILCTLAEVKGERVYELWDVLKGLKFSVCQ